ncbi:MAG TPA: hypothetical protein VFA18_21660, partial [Gemmataceae bacterium]|nr:hypothetical protein [Gemmataceae bacterium]
MIPSRPLHKLLTTPPHRVPPKVWKKIRTALQLRQARRQDSLEPTFCLSTAASSSLVNHYRPTMAPELLGVHAPVILALAGRHTQHCFNLLGSGWLRIEHGT